MERIIIEVLLKGGKYKKLNYNFEAALYILECKNINIRSGA